MVGVKRKQKQCERAECTKQPAFNLEGHTSGRFCKEHKSSDMVDVVSKRCERAGCTARPVFNLEDHKGGRFCAKHKSSDMVDVKHKRCERAGCTAIPVFNLEGKTRARFCAVHKSSDMVDVKNKQCEHAGCTARPTFNLEGKTRARFCKEHKSTDMVDVMNKRCERAGCNAIPAFNLEGHTRGRFCAEHMSSDMVNVRDKRCEHAGCTKRPTFNLKGEKSARFCAVHKSPDMVDVKNKRCEHAGCTVQAVFGFPGVSASFCTRHHPEGTIRRPRRRCEAKGCTATSTHGIMSAERCEAHALPQDENLIERRCVRVDADHGRCDMVDVLNREGHCRWCADHLGTGKRARLGRQHEVQQFLDRELGPEQGYTLSDRVPQDVRECGGRYRPDFLWERCDRAVVLEVDEHQHWGYAEECELVRMMNVSHWLGYERTLWVRYNPDEFASSDSRRWTPAKRRQLLREWLEHALTSSEPGAGVWVLHLFFDGFLQIGAKWRRLDLATGGGVVLLE